jgi:hypothetical protein
LFAIIEKRFSLPSMNVGDATTPRERERQQRSAELGQ